MATWVKDESNDYCNLDLARYISVQPIEEPEDQATYCLIVTYQDQESCWLMSGTEGQCRLAQAKLLQELARRQQVVWPA